MNTIITQDGHHDDDWGDASILHLNGDDDAGNAVMQMPAYDKIMISFASSSDGRGFSLARQLREHGFKGHLRAQGPLVPDQWRHLIKTGFDSLSLTEEQLTKMPLSSWLDVQGLVLPDYQARIMGGPQ